MSQIGGILSLGLQENEEREREARTILEFLRERMDGVERVVRRKSFKERLGLNGMGCCGAALAFRQSTITVREDEDEDEEGPQGPQELIEVIDVGQTTPENASERDCVGHIPASSGMNLAMALAAERHFREAQDSDGGFGFSPSPLRPDNSGSSVATAGTAPGTPLRVPLMRLLEESDGVDGGEAENEREGIGYDPVCCVCMVRNKGSAFIPCGHTFCRVCSRELWLNRSSCPLCNRSILEILDIF